jgi:hypothetical protein
MAKLKEEIAETFEDVRNETIEKIDCLSFLLETKILDDDKNGVLGSEPVFKNAFNVRERGIITTKIFKLIEEL